MRNQRPPALFFLAFMGMELCCLYLLASLSDWSALSLGLSLALYPMALIFKLTETNSTFSRRAKYTLEIALVILVIVLVAGEHLFISQAADRIDVSSVILRLFFCGLTWLMGHTVPRRQVNYFHVAFRLQTGLLAILILSQIVGSVPPVFLFYLLAPLALVLARWADSFSRGANTLKSPGTGHLFLAGASFVVPGTALVLLFSPEVAHAIVNWLRNISDSLSNWVMSQQQTASHQSGRFSLSCNVRPDAGGTGSPDFMSPGPSGGPSGISPVVIWIIVFVIFLLLVTIAFFIIRSRKTGKKARPVEPVQFRIRKVSLNTRGLLLFLPRLFQKLWLWLKSLFQKLKRTPGRPEDTVASIRDIYRSLLRWAAQKGIPRFATQTPLEHLRQLAGKFPEQKDGLRQIIEAYLLARYSHRPVSRDEFFRIKGIWQDTKDSLILLREESK